MAQLIVTDFDGVICDSISECLLASHNAWVQLHSGNDEDRILNKDVIPASRQEKFRRLRPYLRGAEDFIPLLLAAERDLEVESQQDFDLLRRRLQSKLADYQQAFYHDRDYLRTNHRDLWLNLNPLFDGVGHSLGARAHYEGVYILTTKRQPDVMDILTHHGIQFPAEQVHSVASDEKLERLKTLIDRAGVEPEQTIYIEDQIDYLISAAHIGVDVYLAEWGYISTEQRHSADTHKIPVIDRPHMMQLLQGESTKS